MIIKDHLNREIFLKEYPSKIVSIVPSQTELLYDLGLEDKVVGITKFCIHPHHWKKSKKIIGGTKKIDIEKIKALNPDLIIGNKEENTKEDIEALEKLAPVWLSDIYNLEDSIKMIKDIGQITNSFEIAKGICEKIETNFSNFKPIEDETRVAYLIWNKPYMLAGKNTFINDILEKIGFQNFTNESRYPIWEPNATKIPELILLSSEPYPFNEVHVEEIQKQFPNSKILLVNGEYFSWYGSRLIISCDYFSTLINKIKSFH
jgi:ABC-type Fe3+-hydroxamate transport system substrate-binding protein